MSPCSRCTRRSCPSVSTARTLAVRNAASASGPVSRRASGRSPTVTTASFHAGTRSADLSSPAVRCDSLKSEQRESRPAREHAPRPVGALEPAVEHVDRRLPDERGDEDVRGLGVERVGCAHLEEPPLSHHGHPVAERHRLALVVRDEERRDAEPVLERPELRPDPCAELRVQVRERLVHQEGGRLPHERAADRDALLLPPGELSRPLLEQRVDVEELGHLAHPPSRSSRRTPLMRRGNWRFWATVLCG
jgi:hypothetical protein